MGLSLTERFREFYSHVKAEYNVFQMTPLLFKQEYALYPEWPH